jgi:hypothetical protein
VILPYVPVFGLLPEAVAEADAGVIDPRITIGLVPEAVEKADNPGVLLPVVVELKHRVDMPEDGQVPLGFKTDGELGMAVMEPQ